MEPEEISPFFYKCHLKASRKKNDAESEAASRDRPGQSSNSGEGESDGESRLDASGYSDGDASGGFDGE